MAVYKSNTSSGRGNVRRNISTPVAPVAPAPSQIPPVANPVGKARAIANRGKTPIEKARATVAPIIQPPTTPAPEPTTKQPFGCGTPGAGEWGLAAAKNAAMREGNRIYDPKLKQVVVKELPFYFVNIVIPPRPGAPPIFTTMPCPNPNYIVEAPPTPTPDPEKPTKTIIEEIVDKIIADSEETVKEIVVKQEPVREPVIPVQDIVQPPVPITPIETVLENQANCQKDVAIPNINIVNEFNPVIDLNSSATSSISAVVNQEQTVELRGGCMDPDAINYDPAAFIDNGTCEYEAPAEEEESTEPEPDQPVKLNIPDFSPFKDSHGNVLFTVPKDLIEATENGVPTNFIIPVSSIETPANLDLIESITRPAIGDSDLIISEEAPESLNKKALRDAVGGELAEDNPLPTDRDVVIIGNREQLKPKLVRNDVGIIILSSEENIKLTVDLRCQSFKYKDYQKTIDTEVKKLVGKL